MQNPNERVTPTLAEATSGRVSCTEDYAVGAWDNLLVLIWRRNTTADAARDVRGFCESIAREQPGGIFILTLVRAQAPPPDPEARAIMVRLLKDGKSYIRAVAVVIEGKGFRASMVRSVVTGLTFLARSPFPHRVCDLEDAVAMFVEAAKDANVPFAAAQVPVALRLLRQTMELSPATAPDSSLFPRGRGPR
jgi:hypothetical protein